MLAQFGTKRAAVQTVTRGFNKGKIRILAGVALAAVGLGGCLQTAPPLVGVDPADPSAKVSGTGYRSTAAPYTSMRPTAPTYWSGQDNAAAAPKTDR